MTFTGFWSKPVWSRPHRSNLPVRRGAIDTAPPPIPERDGPIVTDPHSPSPPAGRSLDFWTGLFFLCCAGAGWASIATGETLFGTDRFGPLDPGPGLLPVGVLGLLTLGGAGLTASGLWQLAATRGGIGLERLRHLSPAALGFFLSVALLPLAMTVAGYALTSFGFTFVWVYLLEDTRKTHRIRALLQALGTAAAALAIVHFGFKIFLSTPLP